MRWIEPLARAVLEPLIRAVREYRQRRKEERRRRDAKRVRDGDDATRRMRQRARDEHDQ